MHQEALAANQPLEFAGHDASGLQSRDEPVPIPIGAQFEMAGLARRFRIAAFDLQAEVGGPLIGIDREEELGAAEADIRGDRFCQAIGAGQKADPMPVDTAAPSLGNEWLAVARFESEFQDARDALVFGEISNVNAALEIQKLGAKGAGDAQAGEHHRPAAIANLGHLRRSLAGSGGK